MSRTERLLSLLQMLRRHRQPVTAARLAAELGVSVRSVYRDVAVLRDQGASIQGEAGTGYLLKPGFLLPPLMFSDEELEALVLGLRLVVAHGDGALGEAAADVVAKLRAVLPKDLRTLIDESALLAGPARRRPPDTVDLRELRRSIRRQRKARIAYLDEQGHTTTRVVWPLGLGFFEGARVLITWCELRQDFRSFRTDRVSRWQTLPEVVPKSRLVLLREWQDRNGIPAQLPALDLLERRRSSLRPR